jgi:hypothetical protein
VLVPGTTVSETSQVVGARDALEPRERGGALQRERTLERQQLDDLSELVARMRHLSRPLDREHADRDVVEDQGLQQG